MFIRKRVRDCGTRVHFTALHSKRTPAGPRQTIVVSWTTPADPAHGLYAPSVQAALDLAENGKEPWTAGIERWRELAGLHRAHADAVLAAGPGKYDRPRAYAKRCADADHRALRVEAILRDREKQAEGLRTVLAELGNWTWDGAI
jgi:hypothetical protein